MPFSPLISKIRCPNPNKKGSAVRNRNYLTYIGTREGVDLSDPDFEKHTYEQLINSELINEINDDFMEQYSPTDVYLKYISERPKSHGLFGNIDVSDISSLGSRMLSMTDEKKNIYRGIVSLSEKDALQLGYDKKENWIDFMKSTMPDIARQFSIRIEDLQWVAAVHMEKGHPHCHYMFWDTSGKLRSPYIHVSTQNKCRQLLSKEMFHVEREQEILKKTTERDFILEFGKQEFNDLKIMLKSDYKMKLPGRIGQQRFADLYVKFRQLVYDLPASSRITYKLIPADLKKEVDAITELILSHPDVQKEAEQYYNSAKNIAATLSSSKKQTEWSLTKAKSDLEKRIGNIILSAAKQTRKEFLKIDAAQDALIKHACHSTFLMAFSAILRRNRQISSMNQDKQYQAQSKENRIARSRQQKNPHERDGQEP
ncbi:MAG: hypothetical protein J6C33_02350 [Lachnospiraceae bacterium]|nr:hypothetical protein [Lachnospiraceae bacterium]